ncbi:peptide MFS transporter [Hyalangium minutum]|uniref:Di-/tripeptide transporter n=1 Tax=Hyalangium minutum TaxID=394096 RepID=A0A085W6K9_9BACT|nr:peptide MFS transporter [Hyalangium minutum]KFE63322.1 Di-/tripeptide transporter [Hyalangium minutum]
MSSAAPSEWKGPASNRQFMGHPVGLFVLFFTEMWERFSYYGMRGLLKLYMVNYLFISVRQTLQGKAFDGSGNPDDVLGWGFIRSLLPTIDPATLDACAAEKAKVLLASNAGMAAEVANTIARQTCSVEPNASLLYGLYTGLVYLTPVFGGLVADKYLGQKKSVYVGAIIMALGQFVLFGADNLFFVGLLLLIIGNGFFKPNISTQVGNLYPPGDSRRDGAFTIFYMGINIGAFICNFVCGTLAAVYGWRYGFLAAGIGMCIGLVVQMLGKEFLAPDTLQERKQGAVAPPKQKLTKNEWNRVWALIALCLLNVVFWAVYEQQGNTMQTWADEKTAWPSWASSTWFQSVNPFFIFAFAPFLDRFWAMQAKKGSEPSSVAKMAIGCFILGGSFIVMVAGASIVGDGKGSLFWPVFCTMLLTVGELYLSPIGLSLVTKVAPVRIVSLMMGMWFLSSFLGNVLSGYIGQFYTSMSKDAFFLMLMVLGVGAGIAIALFNKPLKKAMQPEEPPRPASTVSGTVT